MFKIVICNSQVFLTRYSLTNYLKCRFQFKLVSWLLFLPSFSGDLRELIASGQVDLEALGKAVLMQKALSASGLSPEHLAKALIMQKAMLDAGATSEHVANCMQKALLESGLSLDELITLMGLELQNCNNLVPDDIKNTLQ